MTATGRTYWMAKDAGWWRREGIVALGEEFGAAGPAVLDWVSCEAKAQNDGGWVKTGFRSIARGCFVDAVTVSHVVSRSVTLGLLDDYEEAGGRFTCRVSGWQGDQERAQAAGRKAAQRARNAENIDDHPLLVTVSHGESRSVTECLPTGQDRTGEQQHPQTPKGDLPVPLVAPVKPSGQRKRDLETWQAEFDAWASEHFPRVEPRGLAGLVSWVQSRQVPATPDAVRGFAEAAPNFAHVLEPAA